MTRETDDEVRAALVEMGVDPMAEGDEVTEMRFRMAVLGGVTMGGKPTAAAVNRGVLTYLRGVLTTA